jgi:glycerol uptake facilitator-like aquaporin
VTIGRAFTDTFAGIDPTHAPGFIVAELLGAVAASFLFGWLFAGETVKAKARRGPARSRPRAR